MARAVGAYMIYALRRFYRDGGLQSAGALTYTTLLALVPLMTIAFSIFSAFPAFQAIQDRLEILLFENLVPEVGSVVRSHISEFMRNATNLTTVGVVGAGAMGSVYAAHFAQAGHEIWAIDTWRAHIDAINADGLRLEGPNGADRRVHNLKAVSDVAQAGACDLYVIATKGAGVGAAAAQIAAVMKPTDSPL